MTLIRLALLNDLWLKTRSMEEQKGGHAGDMKVNCGM